jgi:eukaryotic-like serine/threonine-protein kinase
VISRIATIGLIVLVFTVIAGASAYLTLTFFIKQEDTVVVPDLVGKDVVRVLFELTDLGLNTKVRGVDYSTDIPANHVIFQEPRPGDEIKKNRDVRIVISKGTKTVQTPNLTDLPVSQARIILEENGLCSGAVARIFSSKVRKDGIVSHDPYKGRAVSRGDCVNLLVSRGPRPAAYKMPELSGQALEETILQFETVKLRLGNVRTVSYKNRSWNSIVAQKPLPGHRVLEEGRIDLSVNRPQREDGRISGSGLSGINLFRYRAANGFLKQRLRLRLNGFGGSIDLYDGLLKPGEEIWHLIPENPDTGLLLYEDGELVAAPMGEWESIFGFNHTETDLQVQDFGIDEN